MYLTIAGKQFKTDDIRGIVIKEDEIFLDTTDNFHRIRYSNEEEIVEAKTWLKFHNLNKTELIEAIHLLILTCEFFINTKEQCKLCPLSKKDGCVFTSIPIDWR